MLKPPRRSKRQFPRFADEVFSEAVMRLGLDELIPRRGVYLSGSDKHIVRAG